MKLDRATDLEYQEMEGRAIAAEDDLEALRAAMKDYEAELRNGKFGPVIFRTQVADQLRSMLDVA
jgi:hypothetical protein